jgi:hypothetical protein
MILKQKPFNFFPIGKSSMNPAFKPIDRWKNPDLVSPQGRLPNKIASLFPGGTGNQWTFHPLNKSLKKNPNRALLPLNLGLQSTWVVFGIKWNNV